LPTARFGSLAVGGERIRAWHLLGYRRSTNTSDRLLLEADISGELI
jgi:uncharacterized protein (DUF433 family)